jgi:hypothetical protein
MRRWLSWRSGRRRAWLRRSVAGPDTIGPGRAGLGRKGGHRLGQLWLRCVKPRRGRMRLGGRALSSFGKSATRPGGASSGPAIPVWMGLAVRTRTGMAGHVEAWTALVRRSGPADACRGVVALGSFPAVKV